MSSTNTTDTATADNDLLLSLFVNLRNAASTFGTESEQYHVIHSMVYGHLRQMREAGKKTDLTGAKEEKSRQVNDATAGLADAFERLDLELKGRDRAREDLMEV